MSRVNLLLADPDEEHCRLLKSALDAAGDLGTIVCAVTPEQMLAALKEGDYSLLVLDCLGWNSEGYQLIERVKFLCPQTRTLVLSFFKTDEQVREALLAGADYCLKKPCSPELLLARIHNVLNGWESFALTEQRLSSERRVKKILSDIGMKPSTTGYLYLKYAIVSVILSPAYADALTAGLYPLIAKAFDSTPARVERNMRHAIETTWETGNVDNIYSVFGYTVNQDKGKPTVGEFIALIADTITLGSDRYA